MALRANGGIITKIFKCKKAMDLYTHEVNVNFSFLDEKENKQIHDYFIEREKGFKFSHPECKYRFYILEDYLDLVQYFNCGPNIQSVRYYTLDEIFNIKKNNILFCNISYMKNYDGNISDDKPIYGGQYIKDTGDALEKFNFYICKDNMIRGFVETKYQGGYKNARKANSLHIERINEEYKNNTQIDNVTVVFCARSPLLNKTVIVGWYKNAIVLRNRQKFGEREFNLYANAKDCILLNEEERSYVIPRATIDGIGFGQSNIWYANSSKEEKKITKNVLDYINNYSKMQFFYNIKDKVSNSNIMIAKGNESLDYNINKSILNTNIDITKTYEYSTEIFKKPEAIDRKGIILYKRNKKVAINALGIANFKCEINSEHPTFLRRKDNVPYTESHHLIPMSAQSDFEYSLDVEENIVSLCSNCHNEIHYGNNAKELICKLYNDRKHLLSKKNIFISLEQLLSYYKL